MPEDPSRRRIIATLSAIPVITALDGATPGPATTLPRSAGGPGARGAPAGSGFRFFTPHQAQVIEDATARLVPGPRDDPAEAGHPGAREAGVVRYIDAMLAAFDRTRPEIFAGGPWSNRHTAGPDLMDRFVRLTAVQQIAWRQRIDGWRQQYAAGMAQLDSLAGGDFAAAPPAQQDEILASQQVSGFTGLLFGHTIEAMYANPEYGGNRDLAGWRDIRFPGDVQPRGYTAAEVERSDGRYPAQLTGVAADLVNLFGGDAGTVAAALARTRR